MAVKNIEEVLKRLEIDLHTHVLDWEEFRELQLAFLKASTPNSEIPSDHAIWAVLGDMAEKLKVRYVLTGFNVRTESHLPRAWSQGHFDWRYIQSVHRQFGRGRLKSFPHQAWFRYYRRLFTLRRVDILNYLDYNKLEAMRLLENELNWKYYGGKHHESIYTRFYQGYILPNKFGYDKRRSHLSSQICSGEISRESALEEVRKPAYPPSIQEEDREYVAKKLGMSDSEFDAIMNLPQRSYWDYPSYGRVLEGPLLKGAYGGLRTAYRRMQQRQNRAQEFLIPHADCICQPALAANAEQRRGQEDRVPNLAVAGDGPRGAAVHAYRSTRSCLGIDRSGLLPVQTNREDAN